MNGSQKPLFRLIVTDLDGCLLDSGGNMPGDFESTVDACEKAGCVLCACSGRAVEGVKHPLGRAADRMALITDNGARIYISGEERFARPLPREMWRRVIDEGRKHPGLVVIVTTRWGAFTDAAMPHGGAVDRELVKFYPSWEILDAAAFEEDVIKVSLMYLDDIERNILPYFMPLEKYGLDVKCTAYTWIDIGQQGINKGTGIADLQRLTGIGKEETAVFGDYLNDIPMADRAGRSFAPANAHPRVQRIFTNHIGHNDTYSVDRAIRSLAEGRMPPEIRPAPKRAARAADPFLGDPDRISDEGEGNDAAPERTYRDGSAMNECWDPGDL